MSESLTQRYSPGKAISLLLGPLFFFVVLLMPAPAQMPEEAQQMLACTLWVAIWWIGEPIPIPATSLLPIILLPLSGALSLQHTTAAFGNPVIFLFLGGFMLALAMEKWNLHKRIALNIILLVGTQQQNMVLGFMLATAFLSMWISNTATAMMMLPIGLAIVVQLTAYKGNGKISSKNSFGKALMLGIAYAASIGGLGTLIGTPANAIFAAVAAQLYQQEISFFKWMVAGIPLSLILLLLCWYVLVKIAFPLPEEKHSHNQEISRQLKALGPMSAEEKRVTAVFSLTALAWMSRTFLLTPLLPALDDSMIAMAASISLFIIPASSKQEKQRIIDWNVASQLPWGILLLFGAGLAIAEGFKTTGLAAYIGHQMEVMHSLPLFAVLLLIITIINFLTEITSNTATATMMLPILASLAQALGVHPFGPMLAVCLASSCAFMLPVATPPNAIVFGSGYISMADMVKTGLWLNLLSIAVITLYLYYVLPLLWQIDLGRWPIGFP